MSSVERLARSLEPRPLGRGEAVFHQGEPADAFYLVADGRLDVLIDGTSIDTLVRGDCFGEIGLLHDRPRRASVVADAGEALVLRLGRESFLGAVTGNPDAAREARRIADERPQGTRADGSPAGRVAAPDVTPAP